MEWANAPPRRICETILLYDFEIVGQGKGRSTRAAKIEKGVGVEATVSPACIAPTIAGSKMTSLKEESRVDIRRAPCNWKLLVNVNRFVLE